MLDVGDVGVVVDIVIVEVLWVGGGEVDFLLVIVGGVDIGDVVVGGG